MLKQREHLVYTNDKCIGCSRCIVACPVPEANVSVKNDGKNRIEVDASKCIHCGRCLTVCRHGAREFLDDTDKFLQDLAAGKEISLAVAPAFYIKYKDKANRILGYLKSLGVKMIYNVALGADLSAWSTIKYLEEHPKTSYYAQPCTVIQHYIMKYRPQAVNRLIPVHSPLLCLAVYAHKYLKDTNHMAFLGPCLAKWDEIHAEETAGEVEYNVTFEHLEKKLKGVDLSTYDAEPDYMEYGLGGMYPLTGGLGRNLLLYLESGHTLISEDNVFEDSEFFDQCDQMFLREGEEPVILDILACKNGCVNGTAAGECPFDRLGAIRSGKEIYAGAGRRGVLHQDKAKNRANFEAHFEGLDWRDFLRTFPEKYQQPYRIPEDTCNEIFEVMHKHTEESRHIDCGYCGYPSCKDMVYAIAQGYGRKDNCIHYTQEENRRLYMTDSLTGIANGEAFYKAAGKMLKTHPKTTYVIGVVNVRKFTVINELFGYKTGKNVLRFLAENLDRYLQGNRICARLNADNFAVCIPYRREEMDAFMDKLTEMCESYELEFPLSLNVGLCIADDRNESINLILDHAILALTLVMKSNRVDVAFYDKSLRLRMLREAEITSEMQQALVEKQFEIYLQPQVNHRTGELTGSEALVRWIHPDKGMISPGEFIPVFEKTGFITRLDRFVWEEACRVIADWKKRGRRVIPISVNISRIDILELDLVEVFKEILQKYNVTTDELRLEITESAYVEQGNDIMEIVGQLRAEHFIVEMDDFGSGYSSLNTLKDVPVDVLKLDLKFLSGGESERGDIILKSVVDMATRLKLAIVAEGVETKPQADLLNRLGCETIQGYLYSRPIPVPEFEKMADANKI